MNGSRRIAVTTAADAADRMASRLAAAGLEPVLLPCIRLEPGSAEAIERLRAAAVVADLVVATSARALRTVWAAGMAGLPPVAAVGRATAAVAGELGAEVAVVGPGGALALVDALAGSVSGRTVVYPAAAGADPEVRLRLETAGARVVTEVAYTTVPVAPPADVVDGALFGSPSAVIGWTMARSLSELATIAAIGPTTAAALRDRGRSPELVADRPDVEAVAASLVSHLAERSTS